MADKVAFDNIPMYVINPSASSRQKGEAGSSWCIKVGFTLILIAISSLSFVFKTTNLFGQPNTKTLIQGGGRDWTINDDGSISSKHAKHLVLGMGLEAMSLVDKGSERQLIFDDDVISGLKQGDDYVVLKLKSHPGKGIGKKSEVEQIQLKSSLRYENSALVPEKEAIRVRYEDNNFIKLANEDLVFDATNGERSVDYVGGTSSPTKKTGKGRDWAINDDGTISPKLYPDLVLGSSPPPLVLVKRESPQRFLFDNVERLRSGEVVNATLASHPGMAIGKLYDDERVTGDHAWRYIRSAIRSKEEAIQIHFEEDNYIVLSGEDLVFDVAYWKIVEGNTVNFVGSTKSVQ